MSKYASYWSRVDRRGPDDCWPINGHAGPSGHVHVTVRGVRWFSHRFAYTISRGMIPDGYIICHRCNNPRCNNPRHLYIGTREDNARDSILAGTFRWRHPGFGSGNANAILNEQSVAAIKQKSAAGQSGRSLAREYSVSQAAIAKVLRGETWRHV